MKNLVHKLFSLGKHQVEEAAEKVINLADIKTQGEIICKNIDKKVEDILEGANDAQKMIQECKNDNEKLRVRLNLKNQAAIAAVKAGNDDKASILLTDVETHERDIENNEKIIATLEPLVDQQVKFVNKLRSDQKKLRADIRIMDSNEKMLKVRGRMIGVEGVGCAFNIDDLRKRVENLQHAVEAKEIIKEKLNESDEIVKEFTESSTTESIQERLEKLKAEHLPKE